MKHLALLFMLTIASQQLSSQNSNSDDNISKRVEMFTKAFNKSKNSKPLVSFKDFKTLVKKVEKHRKKRLINLKTFRKMSQQDNVIILDARAEDLYKKSHIKGAINLPFTKFTQANLMRIIPNTETKILIYCNNNIQNDPVNFTSKVALPKNEKPIMLALNIPTYINLYGYGFKNVYELNDVIDVFSSRANLSYIQFEGSDFSAN